ncbi:MAG: hypothetical protein M3Q00_07110 [Pseudomonadota bacterium]|nr:hypothetical protein [Pseudomonadota bacterium]
MTDSSSPQAMFELFQKMANPFAFPLQNFLMPSLSLEDVEKKITELKAVQTWLQTSLGMLEVSIKSLEYQKALLSPSSSEPEKTASIDNPFLDPKNWPWNFLKPDEMATAETIAKPPKKKTAGK